MQLTLGTAKLTATANGLVLNFMPHGNFTIGEQHFANTAPGYSAALRFCNERDLRVISLPTNY
jgi:hypothetical protein